MTILSIYFGLDVVPGLIPLLSFLQVNFMSSQMLAAKQTDAINAGGAGRSPR